ncbi:MAG TPA: tRNA lysidine(34) synthetase TilS [Actinobacteria bacterium]|nr:tRNA lysidine(34) synthetase TilS [Actinomycetota bacterium]
MSGPGPAISQVRNAVRHALEPLAAGDLVLVACSGGADSLALASATAFVAPRAGLRAGAVTVDHGLQEGSAEHAENVVAALRAMGLGPVEVIRVQVGTDGGPEAAARRARYEGLGEAAQRLGAACVLLGHTMDDQAESVLLGLARGSGGRSLSGMAQRQGNYVRPLLNISRHTTQEACRAEELLVWDDPHNADPRYLRSRVRTELLPLMEQVLGPGVSEALSRTAEMLRDDADALDVWAGWALDAAVHREGGLDIEQLEVQLPAVRHRALRQAAIAAGCPAGSLSFTHIDALDRLITHWHGQGPTNLPGGLSGWRHDGRIFLAPQGS